jgi:hypothetical protein
VGAWQVYRGALASSAIAHESALSLWLAEYLRSLWQRPERQGQFQTEIAIERVRERRYPRVVSRLRGFYAFPDELSAVRAAETWPGHRFGPRAQACEAVRRTWPQSVALLTAKKSPTASTCWTQKMKTSWVGFAGIAKADER